MRKVVFVSILFMLLAGCKSTGSSDSMQQVRRNYSKCKSTSSLKNNPRAFDLIMLIQQGKTGEAIAGATRVLLKSPKVAWAYHVRGQAYLNSNQNELAIADLDKAIELDPANGEPYFFRAIAKGNACKSHCRSAIEDLTAALERGTERVELFPNGDKETFDVFLQRSLEFRKNDQLPEALADLNHLIRRSPEALNAYHRRSQIYLRMGDFDKAFEDGRTYHALTNGSAAGYFVMGAARFYQANFSQAERFWNSAFEAARRSDLEDSYMASYLGNLALVNWAAGKPGPGLDWMTQAIRLKQNSSDPLYYIRYGSLLHENGKRQEAAAAFARARGLDANCLGSLKSLEPRYRHNPQMSRFFDRQMGIAEYYLEGNPTHLKASPAEHVKAIAPSLSITSLKVVPSPVAVGRPFDIGIDYTIEGLSSLQEKELTFHFQILSRGKTLFTSAPIAIPARKGPNHWKQNMMPSTARGEYVVKVFLEGVGGKLSAVEAFRIQ